MTLQSVANLQVEVTRLRHELQTIQPEEALQSPIAGDTITVADYLLQRLTQLGVTVSHYSLTHLDI